MLVILSSGAMFSTEVKEGLHRHLPGLGDRVLRRLVVGGLAAVRATGTAFLGAGAEGFVDDGLDGARAAAAFGAAAEATIDLLGIAGKVHRSVDGAANILVADDVAGTNNHENGRPIGDA